ncbi:MAG TPA: FAD-binding oxidoreductase [Actinomycetospora sp.]|jgi:FAD/FMN-containing dehydrogenase|uniref:FAD-binding oxidoreductase n=1 Tax=Actinomycetospora sp. TaxID=1872135 RepID=UPI002F429102
MTRTIQQGADELRAAMSGTVLVAGERGYDEARRVLNADIDRYPAVVARCASATDVAAAVRYARAEGREIAVRGGAHSMSGQSTVDDGLVIDLSGMREVTVDPEARQVRVQGGALLSDMNAATQAHGLAVPAGIVGHTGVSGLTLGGGMGWLTRSCGLSIDNLLGAEVVLADGRIVQTSPAEHPDLCWALRGGGGNFGVVTEFRFRCHEVGPMIDFALFFWGLDQGAEAWRCMREVSATLPRGLTPILGAINAPPAPFVPEANQLQPGYAMMIAGFGSPEQHAAAVEQVRAQCPPLVDLVTPMPFVALSEMFDEANAWGQYYYEKSVYVAEVTDEVIAAITEQAPAKTSPLSIALLYRLDESYCDVGEEDTAFSGGRTPRWATFLVANTLDAASLPAERAWVRAFYEALRPLSLDDTAYVNAMTEDEPDRVRASYGPAKYARLAAIKAEYDPDNAFHRNINIR